MDMQNTTTRALTFPRKEMEVFINEWEENLSSANEETRNLYRIFVNLLAAEENPTALHAKGYGCYGGNAVFACDWKEAARCLKALLHFPGYEYAACALGYIYYYGRLTDKQPEYKKAYRYFARAAAAGNYQAMYKLADMYRKGLYVPADPDLAFQMVRGVYGETKYLFLQGHDDCPFADAALRMGYFLQEDHPGEAATYFLEADLAIRARMKKYNFFGDRKVFSHIRSAIASTGLRPEEVRDKRRTAEPTLFARFLEDTAYDRYLLKIKSTGKQTLKVTLRRLPRRREEKAMPSLLAVPSLQWAARTTSLTLYAYGAAADKEGKTVVVDDMEIDGSKARFYCAGEPVLIIRAEGWELRNKERKRAARKDRVYTFASIQFQEGGAAYDYLCDLPDVKPGDRVIVPGYRGATAVKVVDIFQSTVKDMPLPFERYKKVLGKEE